MAIDRNRAPGFFRRFLASPATHIYEGTRKYFARLSHSPVTYILIGFSLGWVASPFVSIMLSIVPDRFSVVLAAGILITAFLLGYLFALVRTHYSSMPIQVAAINVRRATGSALAGFLVTTLMPILIAYALEGEITLTMMYVSIMLGGLGGIVVFWVFLGMDIRAYLDYRFDGMVIHSALWTDEGVFERTLDMLKSLGQPNRRWIFGKFLSRKLTEDFQPVGSLTLAINNFHVTEYSHLLSTLIAESREYVHMTCPLDPDAWVEAVFTECEKCEYLENEAEEGGEKRQMRKKIGRDESKGQCILSCDSKIIRCADEVFDFAQNYAKPIPTSRITSLSGYDRSNCRLRQLGLKDSQEIPRHLRAVNLSGASRDRKIRLIGSCKKWEKRSINPSCVSIFFEAHQLTGNMFLREYQGDLDSYCGELYKEITGDDLDDKYFDFNILDGILIGFTGFRKIKSNEKKTV